jgi:hypothetical protein
MTTVNNYGRVTDFRSAPVPTAASRPSCRLVMSTISSLDQESASHHMYEPHFGANIA